MSEPYHDEPECIVSVAVFHGAIWSLPKPARHSNVLETIDAIFQAEGVDFAAISVPPINQGFLTSKGRFVNRSEAMSIAYSANQLISKPRSHELYSEDLW